jgi:hypothetical protein
MDMRGERQIAAGRQAVWQALNDPETLKACIPGCESFERLSDVEHVVTLVAAVGPVKAKFKGTMQLRDLDPPSSYTLAFEGQGGVAGFARGQAQVTLSEEGPATKLGYHVHAQVSGKLAQVGSRLVDAAARKVAEDFFSAFNARVGAAPAPGAARGARIPAAVWIAAAAAAALAAYLLLR